MDGDGSSGVCVGGFDGVRRFRLRRKTLACALGIQTVPILHIILIQHDRGGAHVHLITYTHIHRGERRKRENKIQMKINKIKTGSDEGRSEKEKRETKRKDVNRHSFKCIQLSCA